MVFIVMGLIILVFVFYFFWFVFVCSWNEVKLMVFVCCIKKFISMGSVLKLLVCMVVLKIIISFKFLVCFMYFLWIVFSDVLLGKFLCFWVVLMWKVILFKLILVKDVSRLWEVVILLVNSVVCKLSLLVYLIILISLLCFFNVGLLLVICILVLGL